MITYGHKDMLPVSKVSKKYGIEQSTCEMFQGVPPATANSLLTRDEDES